MELPSPFAEKLGRCPRCMGASLGLALACATAFGITLLAGLPLLVIVPVASAAAAFVALSLAHTVVFAYRATRAEATPCRHCGGSADGRSISRRQLIGIAGRAVIAAAALSLWNVPGLKRVLAQEPGKCEDVGGPLKYFDKICVTQTDTEEQIRQRLMQQGQEWIAANEGTFEATARGNCNGKTCKGDQRCVAVHYRVGVTVRCSDDRTCESGRSCDAVVSMGVICRCGPRECSSTKLDPGVEISAEVCTRNENPTKKELEEACKQACQQVEALAQAAAARVCDQEPCPPVGGTRPKCKPRKVHQTKLEFGRVKDRPNCCRCSTTISGVQCKCD